MSRLIAVLGLTLCGACTPLVATVGREVGDDADDDAAHSEPPGPDATTLVEAGSILDGAAPDASDPVDASETGAPIETMRERCLYFPDVIGPFHESGITSVDGGVITASLDQALSCPMAEPTAVTYRRNDGRPLVDANRVYAWVWPSGGGGSMTAYAADNLCEQPLLPFDYWILVKDFPPSCKTATFGTAFHVLRVTNVQSPTPFPQGFSLCEPPCP